MRAFHFRSPIVSALVFAAASAHGAVLTVNSTADATTPANGFVTLHEAILAAENGGTDLGEVGSGADRIVFAGSRVRDVTAGGNVAAAPIFAQVPEPYELADFGPVGPFVPSGNGDVVYEISAGGDFTAAEPFATGVLISGGFADMMLVEGCGDGIFDEATEECEDGNAVDGDGCSATCEVRCAPSPEVMCNGAASANVSSTSARRARRR